MKTPRYRNVEGFTLLEVLIAIVVVAFGLLGLAGLQVFALKNNTSAAQRVTATNLATDIIDRMRANYQGVVNGGYDKPSTGSYNTSVSGCNGPPPGCTPNELATNDLFEWSRRVAAALPGGVGIVCLDSTAPSANPLVPEKPTAPECDGTGISIYVVKIFWYDDRTPTNPGGNLKYVYMAFNP
jgi:type IV pilus assembly protein PilV